MPEMNTIWQVIKSKSSLNTKLAFFASLITVLFLCTQFAQAKDEFIFAPTFAGVHVIDTSDNTVETLVPVATRWPGSRSIPTRC